MTALRLPLMALALPLLAGLAGCDSEPGSAPVSQISKDEAQALEEAESMLAEQRMAASAAEPSGTETDPTPLEPR